MAGRSGQVRIIAGQWRGRKIEVIEHQGLRPTTDRVRETLFNWLQFEIPGSRCLDLFAGTGVLGFEAISRGAASLTLVEQNQRVSNQLNNNILVLGCKNATVVNSDATGFITGSVKKKNVFDVVFLDPPYDRDLLQNCSHLLEESGILSENALIYAEHRTNQSIEFPASWQCIKTKKAGQVQYMLFQRQES